MKCGVNKQSFSFPLSYFIGNIFLYYFFLIAALLVKLGVGGWIVQPTTFSLVEVEVALGYDNTR